MKKFIKISTYVLAGLLTVLGALAIVSFVYSLANGIFKQYMIKGAISLFLIFGSGISLFIVKKDVDSIPFYIVLGVVAFVAILERTVFYGVMGFGSALFNLIKYGSSAGMEKVISVLLILIILYLFAIIFISLMEKYTGKPIPKNKGRRK